MRIIIIPDRDVFDVVQTTSHGEVVLCKKFDKEIYDDLASKKVSWAYTVLSGISWSRILDIAEGAEEYKSKYASEKTIGFIRKGEEYRFVYGGGGRLTMKLESQAATIQDLPVYLADGWEYFARDTSFPREP